MTTPHTTQRHDVVEALLDEARAITTAAERLDTASIDKALAILVGCTSKVVVSGVGKSGIVARKIAATLSSVGLVSLYLNPLDALHGDLGVVAEGDVILLLSNSGETQELLAVLPHLRRRGTQIISIVGNLQSTLGRTSDVALDASVDAEVGPHNIVPTSSTTVAMAIGDALATVWMQRRQVSADDFATNHPGGQLGKRLTLFVRDLMVPIDKVRPIASSTSLVEVIDEITTVGIGAIWVRDSASQKAIDGIITDGDLRRALKMNKPDTWASLRAADIMTKDPITIADDVLAIHAIERMERNNKKAITLLPVVGSTGVVTGILRLHDLVQAGLITQSASGD